MNRYVMIPFLAGLLLSLAAPLRAQPGGELPDTLRRVAEAHGLPPESFAAVVREVGAAEPLLAVNPDRSMHPASTVKLVTTLAALETLGPTYVWQTGLYALGPVRDGVLEGDLLLRGRGDPFMVEERLRAMLKALRRQGVRDIRGDLVLDGTYFDPSVSAGEGIDRQTGRAYNTLPHAVLANFQTVNFYFSPHPDGRRVVIRTDPALPNLRVDNRLSLVDRSCGGYRRGISFHQNPLDPNEVIFEGRFPAACDQYHMVREVLSAPAYTFGLFKLLWEEIGGSLEGGFRPGALPEDAEPLLIWQSQALSDIIKSVNKYSNNLMTRHLLLTLGAETRGAPATVEKGVAAVRDYLESRNLDASALVLDNGAGLSRETRLSAALLDAVLQQGWRGPWMPEFAASLPLNGLDGTMRNRLRGERMEGRMHIKTGSLNQVAAVAGYVHTPGGRVFAVSGIVNHPLADRGPGAELLDALLLWVWLQ